MIKVGAWVVALALVVGCSNKETEQKQKRPVTKTPAIQDNKSVTKPDTKPVTTPPVATRKAGANELTRKLAGFYELAVSKRTKFGPADNVNYVIVTQDKVTVGQRHLAKNVPPIPGTETPHGRRRLSAA